MNIIELNINEIGAIHARGIGNYIIGAGTIFGGFFVAWIMFGRPKLAITTNSRIGWCACLTLCACYAIFTTLGACVGIILEEHMGYNAGTP